MADSRKGQTRYQSKHSEKTKGYIADHFQYLLVFPGAFIRNHTPSLISTSAGASQKLWQLTSKKASQQKKGGGELLDTNFSNSQRSEKNMGHM